MVAIEGQEVAGSGAGRELQLGGVEECPLCCRAAAGLDST